MLLTARLIHILGWAQWMGAALTLAGLLRRPGLFQQGVAEPAAAALKSQWVTGIVGIAMAWAGAIWMLVLNPGYMQVGWVHVKLTLGLALTVVYFVPLRKGYGALATAGAPLKGLWFGVQLALFVAMIVLAVYKPF